MHREEAKKQEKKRYKWLKKMGTQTSNNNNAIYRKHSNIDLRRKKEMSKFTLTLINALLAVKCRVHCVNSAGTCSHR